MKKHQIKTNALGQIDRQSFSDHINKILAECGSFAEIEPQSDTNLIVVAANDPFVENNPPIKLNNVFWGLLENAIKKVSKKDLALQINNCEPIFWAFIDKDTPLFTDIN